MRTNTADTATDDQSAFDEAGPMSRAALDRVARDLVEQKESIRGEVLGGSFTALVVAHDARLWAAIDLGSAAGE